MNNKFKRALSSVLAVVMMISVFATVNVSCVFADSSNITNTADSDAQLPADTYVPHQDKTNTSTGGYFVVDGDTNNTSVDKYFSYSAKQFSSSAFELNSNTSNYLSFTSSVNGTVIVTCNQTPTYTLNSTTNTGSTSYTSGTTISVKQNDIITFWGDSKDTVGISKIQLIANSSNDTTDTTTDKVTEDNTTTDTNDEDNDATDTTKYTVNGKVSTKGTSTITISGGSTTYTVKEETQEFTCALPSGTYTVTYDSNDYTVSDSSKTFTITDSDVDVTITLIAKPTVTLDNIGNINDTVTVNRYEFRKNSGSSNTAVIITTASSGAVITNATNEETDTTKDSYVSLKTNNYVAFKIKAGEKYAVRLNSGDSPAVLAAYNGGKIDGVEGAYINFDSSYRLTTILLEAGETQDATFIINGASSSKATKMKNITFYDPSVLRVIAARTTNTAGEVILVGQFIGTYPEDYSEIGFALSKEAGQVVNVNNSSLTTFHSTGEIYEKVYIGDSEEGTLLAGDSAEIENKETQTDGKYYYYATVVTDVPSNTPFYVVGYTKLNGVICRDTGKVYKVDYDGTAVTLTADTTTITD